MSGPECCIPHGPATLAPGTTVPRSVAAWIPCNDNLDLQKIYTGIGRVSGALERLRDQLHLRAALGLHSSKIMAELHQAGNFSDVIDFIVLQHH